jgi:hypothetical protein
MAEFLVNYMQKSKLSMITVFHPGLSEALGSIQSPFIYKKRIIRPYLIASGLEIPELSFQDGDGDSVFA